METQPGFLRTEIKELWQGMKDLYLLTTGYPYPAKSMETYLETEVKYYANFRSVKILSMGVRKKKLNQKRKVPGDNIEVYPIIFGSKLYYGL